MGAIASQITSLTIVCSTIYSDADQRKQQSSASLAFVWGIHRGLMNSPHKWPVTRKMFPFDDVIMCWCPMQYWSKHDDVIKWKHFPRYWPFVRGIYQSPVNPPHIGQWRGALSYNDVIMGTIASQITNLTIVYSIIYSDTDQRKHQSSASLAFVWGIHRGPVNSPHKWPVTRKMFPFDDVIMYWCPMQYWSK